MITMIHFTLHQNQTDDKCSPNSQAITTTSTEWWRRGGNTTLTEFTLSLSEKKYLCVKLYLFSQKSPQTKYNLFGYTCLRCKSPDKMHAHAGRFVTGRSHVCTR